MGSVISSDSFRLRYQEGPLKPVSAGLRGGSSLLKMPHTGMRFGGKQILRQGFSGGLAVENLLAIQEPQETRVRSLGREDLQEEEMQPTPGFLPGESYGSRTLVGYSPWGRKESDTTERLSTHTNIDERNWKSVCVQINLSTVWLTQL